ncbi:PorP/SprF family type IX secretion system membrane protein [Robiginitalea sp. M366]|uniref:PorP/SprF family type IX secretion system membrane protein n=1 Tax=Robiginitalea aestuariiviva TaxID=3036903 RepID=UPI00240D4625|nr:PorP/SprF family type IX secretion system membrane protein [Robiginitalea aestuariiviva]MDG1571508.1 PorP/SprF family type IX secretion system membrane protein [Robiginitalea aestuariiviva]
MKRKFLFLMVWIALLPQLSAQEDNPFIAYDVPSQNLLKFNRFLINPTFSTVREDKSYVNLLHRNQAVSFDDNNQMYFLSYSGRIGDRSGLGLSLYTQREGTLSNYGVLANYAYGVKLSDKSNFTFGANLSYYNSGFDESRANPVETDPFLSGFQDSSFLTFQPGFNLSYGAFDFGMYAENLIDYNLKTNEAITSFKDKTFSGHLQYTHQFQNDSGVFEGGRLMPLARARKVGEDDFVLGGNLILDLPKVGWLQGGYDSFYGASAGIGFNLNRRLSIGYTMEKGLSDNFDNFGVTHEISFAYSFTPNLTEDRVMLEDGYEDSLVEASPEDSPESATEKDAEIAELKRRLSENDDILAELMFRQDSLEQNRQRDLEKRFEMVMRMVRQETGGNRPDLEEKARQVYYLNNQKDELAEVSKANIPTGINEAVAEDTAPVNTGMQPEETRQETAVVAVQEPTRKEVVRKDDIQPVQAVAAQQAPVRKAMETAQATTAVKHRKFRDLNGVEDGYYVVANVYRGTKYMHAFVEQLQREGLDAAIIDNPNNGLKYVYLKRFDQWKDAESAVKTGLQGQYTDQMWVMNVANRYTNEAYAANADRIREASAKYERDVLRQNVIVRDKLAEKNQTEDQQPGMGGYTDYYLIVNVFANPNNANRFVRTLNAQGLSASYFINPENNYRYVYLKRHDNWNSALISYYSKLNNAYDDNMWIMRVTPNLIA